MGFGGQSHKLKKKIYIYLVVQLGEQEQSNFGNEVKPL